MLVDVDTNSRLQRMVAIQHARVSQLHCESIHLCVRLRSFQTLFEANDEQVGQRGSCITPEKSVKHNQNRAFSYKIGSYHILSMMETIDFDRRLKYCVGNF